MITTFENFKFYKKGASVKYSAVVLDQKSRNLLLQRFIHNNPEFDDWIKICHHMTICMGELPEHLKRYWLDEEVGLTVTHVGSSDKALAVKVQGFFTLSKQIKFEGDIENRYPHITLAINPIDAAPKDSNYITEWQKIDKIKISGIVKEIS